MPFACLRKVHDGTDRGLRLDALDTTGKAELFFRRGLDVDPLRRQVQQPRHIFSYGGLVRTYAGLLGNDSQVHIGEAQPLPVEQAQNLVQQYRRGNIVKGGVRIGEVFAYVAQAGAAEQGVHQRMQQHIAVGVRHDFHIAFQQHAAQAQRPSRPVAVHIVAETDAGKRLRHGIFRQEAQIFGMGDLAVVALAFDHDHGMPLRLHQNSVVGRIQSLFLRRGMRGPQQAGVKALRRLYRGDLVPGQRRGNAFPVQTFDRIRHAQPGHDGRGAFQPRQHAMHQSGGQKGTRRVVHENMCAVLRQGFQPVTHGVLTARAAGNHHPGQPRVFFGGNGPAVFHRKLEIRGGKDEDQPPDSAAAAEGTCRMPVERTSPPFQKLLGRAVGGCPHAAASPGGHDNCPGLLYHLVPL